MPFLQGESMCGHCHIINKSSFISSDQSNFHMINNLSMALYTFPRSLFTLPTVNEIILPIHTNCSNKFGDILLRLEMVPFCLLTRTLFICIHLKCTIARYGYAKWTYNVYIYIYIYNIGISKHEKT